MASTVGPATSPDDKSVRGSADGCDVVLHIAGIVEEKPPRHTFQAVNIDGTRYVVLEAERAGVQEGRLRIVARCRAGTIRLSPVEVRRRRRRARVQPRLGRAASRGASMGRATSTCLSCCDDSLAAGDSDDRRRRRSDSSRCGTKTWRSARASSVERDTVRCCTLEIAGQTSRRRTISPIGCASSPIAPRRRRRCPRCSRRGGFARSMRIGSTFHSRKRQLRDVERGQFHRSRERRTR